MVGRQNKNLVLRLLKCTNTPHYQIVVVKKRSTGVSRLDRIGSIASPAPYAWLKIDLIKLSKYLVEKNIKILYLLQKYSG
jgi:hypothetical protein